MTMPDTPNARKSSITNATALACGFTRAADLKAAKRLTERQPLLAAMALTFHRSPWSDRRRDLNRGVEGVLTGSWT